MVKKDPVGQFYEEFSGTYLASANTTNQIDRFSLRGPSDWNNRATHQQPPTLPPASANSRQQLAFPSVA
jgi:hypothetical protein